MRHDRRGSMLRAVAVLGVGAFAGTTAVSQVTVFEEVRLVPSWWGAGSGFGRSISLSGDRAVGGAFGDHRVRKHAGSVYVFAKGVTGWSEVAALAPSDLSTWDQFGWSVSLDGTRLLAGSRWDDDADPTNSYCQSGSAYVFEETAGVWQETAKLVAFDTAAGDEFGFAVVLEGDIAVVGAPNSDRSVSNGGAVYIYRYDGSRWVEKQVLTSSDGSNGARFGCAVALSGELLVVGAEVQDGTGDSEGAAYVFRDVNGRFREECVLHHPDPHYGEEFGHAVATDGRRVVVGAWKDNEGGEHRGTAHVFVESSGIPSWKLEESLTSPEVEDELSYFGVSVAIEDDVLIIGADYNACEDPPQLGRVFSFGHDGQHWQWMQRLRDSDEEFATFVGGSVDLENGWILAGGIWARAAYLFPVRELMLEARPREVDAGSPLTLESCTGEAGGLVLLAVTAVDGSPIFQPITFGRFSKPGGRFEYSTTVPPGLSGVTLELTAFGASRLDHAAPSNVIRLPIH